MLLHLYNGYGDGFYGLNDGDHNKDGAAGGAANGKGGLTGCGSGDSCGEPQADGMGDCTASSSYEELTGRG